MFNLPKSCLVNKVIPKKTFYKKTNFATSVKEEFTDLIDKIEWSYKISPDTLGVNRTQNVEEIEVFEVELKQKKLPKNVIKTITKVIPYPIVFVIKYNDNFCYSIKVEENYYSDWDEKIEINFNGINLESIYQQLVRAIIKENNEDKTFERIIEDNNQKKILQKKMKQLKRKIKQEKQFNRKIELNQELRRIEKEMEEIKNG